MQLGLVVLAGLVAMATAERQRFCYKRVGYTRKHAEVVSDAPCEGPDCTQRRADTHYKTELVFRTERHCCGGYERAGQSPDVCIPVCSRGCPQGERCTAPNRCECEEGHERDSAGRCVAAAGAEPTTLQAHILSYVSFLLDGVKSLSWQQGDLGSAPPAHEDSPSGRAAPGEHFGAGGEALLRMPRCVEGRNASAADGHCLQAVWLPAGTLERRWNGSSLPLGLAAPGFATPQLQ